MVSGLAAERFGMAIGSINGPSIKAGSSRAEGVEKWHGSGLRNECGRTRQD
jgi:hypothetical protein